MPSATRGSHQLPFESLPWSPNRGPFPCQPPASPRAAQGVSSSSHPPAEVESSIQLSSSFSALQTPRLPPPGHAHKHQRDTSTYLPNKSNSCPEQNLKTENVEGLQVRDVVPALRRVYGLVRELPWSLNNTRARPGRGLGVRGAESPRRWCRAWERASPQSLGRASQAQKDLVPQPWSWGKRGDWEAVSNAERLRAWRGVSVERQTARM